MIKPVTLQARWHGPPPALGDYLKAPRGRTAYLIHAIAKIVPRGYGQPMLGHYRLRIKCWRVPPSEVPQGAAVHPWKWDRR